MDLTPREKDKLLIFTAALLAERRMALGVKLNYPEAVAYVSTAILERARDALWKPAFFGAEPAMVLKGGMFAAAAMGDPNASIPGTGGVTLMLSFEDRQR